MYTLYESQSRFAIFILAYGISNVAVTVGYEITLGPVNGDITGIFDAIGKLLGHLSGH